MKAEVIRRGGSVLVKEADSRFACRSPQATAQEPEQQRTDERTLGVAGEVRWSSMKSCKKAEGRLFFLRKEGFKTCESTALQLWECGLKLEKLLAPETKMLGSRVYDAVSWAELKSVQVVPVSRVSLGWADLFPTITVLNSVRK